MLIESGRHTDIDAYHSMPPLVHLFPFRSHWRSLLTRRGMEISMDISRDGRDQESLLVGSPPCSLLLITEPVAKTSVVADP